MATKASKSNFFFVDPAGDPESLGYRDAYDGETPSRAFVQTSWEWLYERYLRRVSVLSAIGKPRQKEYLAERNGVFRLHRTVPENAGHNVREPHLSPGFYVASGSPPVVIIGEGDSYLPDGREREKDGKTELRWTDEKTFMLARELGPAVVGLAARQVGSASFLAAAPVSKSAEASLTITGEASSTPVNLNPHDYDDDRSDDNVDVHNEIYMDGFDRSFFPVFRLVEDFRQDDDPEERTVKVWDVEKGEFAQRTVFMATVRNPKEPSYDPDRGEFRKVTWDGGREDGYIKLFRESLSRITYDGLGIPVVFGPGIDANRGDLGPCDYHGVGGTPVGDDGDYVPYASAGWSGRNGRKDVMGFLVPGDEVRLPDMRRGGDGVLRFASGASSSHGSSDVVIGGAGGRARAITHPSPRWDGGKPTCWAAWGFPHLDPRPASEVLGGQLAATCLPQPCVPPGFAAKLPAASDGSRDDAYGGYSDPGSARKRCPAAPACEPAEISRMLSRLDRTLVPVGDVFARVSGFRKTERTEDRSSKSSTTCPPVHSSSYHSESTETDDLSGYFIGPFGALLWAFDGTSGDLWTGANNPQLPYSSTWKSTTEVRGDVAWYWSYEGGIYNRHGHEAHSTVTKTFEAELSAYVVTPLRSGTGLQASPVVRHRKNESRGYNGETHPTTPVDRTTGGDYGPDLPPKDSALLLHPDVLAWAKSASLVAVFDVQANPYGGSVEKDSMSVDYDRHNDHSGHTYTVLSSRSESSGRRTGWRKLSVVTVGTLDLGTCAVAEVDLLELARRIYPSGAEYGVYGGANSRVSVYTGSASGCNSTHYRHGESTHKSEDRTDETHSFTVKAARLYVSVEWDFDRTDPPKPSGATGLPRRIADATAVVARAAQLLSRTRSWLSTAEARVRALLAELAEFDMLPRQWDEEVGDAYSAARSAVAAFSSAVDGAKELVDAAEEAVLAAEGAAAAISEPPDPSDVSALESAAEAAEAAAQELSDAAYEALVADMDASTAVRALRGAQVAAGLDV